MSSRTLRRATIASSVSAALALTAFAGAAPSTALSTSAASAGSKAESVAEQNVALAGDEVFPEGIAVDQRTGDFYVGSVKDGTVYRGTVGSPNAEAFLPAGSDGRSIVNGIAIHGDTLVTLSRQLGTIRSYDLDTKELLDTVEVPRGENGTFINDLVFAPDGSAYVTDSINPWLNRITWDGDQMKVEKFMDFTDTALQYTSAAGAPGINLNGIVASEDGRYLVVSKRNENALYRITLADKSVTKVDVAEGVLNTQDGLFLRGRTLYAAQNLPNNVVKLRFNGDFTAATLRETYTNPNYKFVVAAAVYNDKLLVSSSQFDSLGSPAAVSGDTPPDLPFRITITSMR